MGYQTVEVEDQTAKRKATVYNAELLMWDQEPRAMLIEAFETLISKASVSEAKSIRSIKVVSPPKVVVESIVAKYLKHLQGTPATEGIPGRRRMGKLSLASLHTRMTVVLHPIKDLCRERMPQQTQMRKALRPVLMLSKDMPFLTPSQQSIVTR